VLDDSRDGGRNQLGRPDPIRFVLVGGFKRLVGWKAAGRRDHTGAVSRGTNLIASGRGDDAIRRWKEPLTRTGGRLDRP
jgi:hypothetical protein